MTSLLHKQNVRESFQGRELEEKFDLLVDVNEVILDNIVSTLRLFNHNDDSVKKKKISG